MNIYKIILPGTCLNGSSGVPKRFKEDVSEHADHHILSSTEEKDILPVNQKFHHSRYGFYLSKTEIEIFALHRMAWKKFLESGEESCSIIDNSISEEYLVQLKNVTLSLDGYWDIIFPFTKEDVLDAKDELQKKEIKNYNSREYKDYDSYFLGKKWGFSIYFISRSGAEKLLKIEEIRQNIDDEILFQASLEKLNVFCNSFSLINYKDLAKIFIIEREKEIYSAILRYKPWDENSLQTARHLLKTISLTAYKFDISLLLQGGTLLGHIQHNALIPWDDDIDIGVETQDFKKLKKEIKKIKDFKIKKFVEAGSNAPYYKIWSIHGTPIKGYSYTFPFVDIWLYDIIGKDIIFKNGIICTNSAHKNFIEVQFEYSRFSIPFNYLDCLDERYKTWRETFRIYTWSHKYEKPLLYPLKLAIKTSKRGKLIAPIFKIIEDQGY